MKDYSGWEKKKLELEKQTNGPDFSERDIWWCSIGLNIGDEEDGKNEEFERPVLIIRKFNKNIFVGLPVTSSIKNNAFYFPLNLKHPAGSIILSQIRLLSAKRLRRKIFRVGRKKFQDILEKHRRLFI